jgi:secreted trypsin-like serine protease
MRRRMMTGLIALFVAALVGMPAAAVTYGEPDGNAHPYVGLVVFYDSSGAPTHRCSGTLLSSTVFLTAGHCTDGTASAQIWFDEHVTTASGYPYSGGVTGSTYTHPSFNFSGLPATYDVGVVVLNKPVKMKAYGALPSLGVLDRLATKRGTQSVSFTVVGYGLQEVKPTYMAERSRLRGTVQLVNLSSALTDGYNLQATNAPGTGGGTCFGDSGGPVFIENTKTIAGVNSFVLNSNCKGAGFAFRMDLATSQDFVGQFL